MINQNYISIYAKSFNWAGFFLPKKTFQDGCHTIYLKNHKERIKESYLAHYGQRNPLENFLNS